MFKAIVFGFFKAVIVFSCLLLSLDAFVYSGLNLTWAIHSVYLEILPVVFMFFYVVQFIDNFALKNKDNEQLKALKQECFVLGKILFDIGWLVPLVLCSIIANNSNVVALYVGAALALLAFCAINAYNYVKFEIGKNLNANKIKK